MDKFKLDRAIRLHRVWIESNGENGKLADLMEADLNGANLRESNLQGANLHGANLQKADLNGANLSEAILSKADLRGACLARANFHGANLREADLLGVELQSVDLEKADLRFATLRKANLQKANLSKANLQGANLIEADLKGVNLKEANLSSVNCRSACLKEATMQHANLQDSDLRVTNLSQADLSYANLSRSQLLSSDMRMATLLGANLQEAHMFRTNMEDANLSQAIFSSKAAIAELKFSLNEKQMLEATFKDEKRTYDDRTTFHDSKVLKITINSNTVSSSHLGYLLAGITATFNNLFYLTITEDSDIEIVRKNITPFYNLMRAEDELYVRSLKSGSLIVELSSLASTPQGVATILGGIVGLIYTACKIGNLHWDTILKKEQAMRLINKNDTKSEERIEPILDAKYIGKHVEVSEEEYNVLSMLRAEKSNNKTFEFHFRNSIVIENEEELLAAATQPLELTIIKLTLAGHGIAAEMIKSDPSKFSK